MALPYTCQLILSRFMLQMAASCIAVEDNFIQQEEGHRTAVDSVSNTPSLHFLDLGH